jgi:hypothetical protein
MMVLGLNDGNLDITPSTSIKTIHKCVCSNYTNGNAMHVIVDLLDITQQHIFLILQLTFTTTY